MIAEEGAETFYSGTLSKLILEDLQEYGEKQYAPFILFLRYFSGFPTIVLAVNDDYLFKL